MILRKQGEDVLAITQPAHSWMSGQLARAWGNERFVTPIPREDVCLAAALHDIGFLEWDRAPTLNVSTGLPHTFLDMPSAAHHAVWSEGVRQMLALGRYPALLVSLHVTGLCQRHQKPDSPREAEAIAKFLSDQDELQTSLRTSLSNDWFYEAHSDDAALARNRSLISIWDWMSLLFCMGFAEEQLLEDVPARSGAATLRLNLKESSPCTVAVEPWPFRTESVTVVYEQRRLLRSYADEGEMRRALKAALPVSTTVRLEPGVASEQRRDPTPPSP